MNARDHHQHLSAELHTRMQWATTHGKDKTPKVRRRVQQLLDPQSPFLELSMLAGWHQNPAQCLPSGGIVCGIGKVAERLCMIIANDPEVKAGAYFPITIKKHLRAQHIAEENALPCIYLVDSAGIYLPQQSQVFADAQHFGRIFYNQARMSAQRIPQIAIVLGMCTAGGAYVPALADQNIMVEDQATMSLAGPLLVEAATGESVDPQALGGALMHTQRSGVADHRVAREEDAFQLCRQWLQLTVNQNAHPRITLQHTPQPPAQPATNIYTILPPQPKMPLDMQALLQCLVDQHSLVPHKPDYGTTLLCAFARWHGIPVGIVASQGILFGKSAQKGAQFVLLCEQRRIPILFVHNVTGFMVGKEVEEQGIINDGAHMVQAISCATVPKITLIVGSSNGAGNYAMCGRAFQPRFLFTWPQARVGVMGPQQASKVMAALEKRRRHRITTPPAASQPSIAEQYETEMSPYWATAQLWDDGLIDPLKTRDTIALALTSCRMPLAHETLGHPPWR